MTHPEPPTLRLTLVSLIVIGLFAALFSRLWFLQVLAAERYGELAERNRVGVLVLEAPRGRILDRNGEEVVKNRPAQTISAHPRQLLNSEGAPRDAEAAAVLARLADLLGFTTDQVVERLSSRRYSPFRAVPIAEDVPIEAVFYVRENQELFRGVVAEVLPVRAYPHGALGAHLVGFLGEISEAQLDYDEYRGYRRGDLIGVAGLERTYEAHLRGQTGLRRFEVNARGVVLRDLDRIEPKPGNDVTVSLDVGLQRAVEEILTDGIRESRNVYDERRGLNLPAVAGAAVVIDPRDGSVLAMASYPTFDPSEFVGGVSRAYWDWLNDPANEFPLLNRAIQSAHPPGSTFKIVSAASALETGLAALSTRVPCPPSWTLAEHWTFRNWNPVREPDMTIQEALVRSCDTVFYELAHRQWLVEERQLRNDEPVDEAMARMGEAFGFGRRLSIDLPGETTGIMAGRTWRLAYWEQHRDRYCEKAEGLTPGSWAQLINEDLCLYGGRWRGGDAVNTSIGQGDVLTSPLQIAAAFAAIANGGTLYRPHLGLQVTAPDGTVVERFEPQVIGQLPLTSEQIRYLQVGLEEVVMNPRGTAAFSFTDFPTHEIPVAGKTGTAEMKPKVPFAWFVAYAPANDPRYVVAVAVEEGGGGSQTAAPIVRRILQSAFGLELTPFREGPRTD